MNESRTLVPRPPSVPVDPSLVHVNAPSEACCPAAHVVPPAAHVHVVRLRMLSPQLRMCSGFDVFEIWQG